MKKRTSIPLIALFVLLVIAVTPIAASPPSHVNLPSHARAKMHRLPGQISIYWIAEYGGGEITISTHDIVSIRHGFHADDPWSTLTPEQQDEFMDTASFTLLIGVEEQDLEPVWWYNKKEDVITYTEYITFLQNHFEPGEYEFTGIWYAVYLGEPLELTLTITVFVV